MRWMDVTPPHDLADIVMHLEASFLDSLGI